VTSSQSEVRAATPVPPARLEIQSLSKTFGENRVLSDVGFSVRAGEIHALVGQNGSGKSTVAKILSGLYTPDDGSVVSMDGKHLGLPMQPIEARRSGMAVVHQSLGLLDSFSVIENLRIGRLKGRGPLQRIDWREERRQATEVFDRIGRSVPFDAKVGDLREEERSVVAIARALQDAESGAGLIIFDESTRALSRRALEHFFILLDEIVVTGTAVLMITHRLEEVLDAADRVTVLRDGKSVASGLDVAGLDEATLTGIILGRAAESHVPADATKNSHAPVISVTGLTGRDVQNIDLSVHRGEVIGLTGLAGSGYEDVPYLLSGVAKASAGSVKLPDLTLGLRGLTPAGAIAAGIGLLPQGRDQAGLAMHMSSLENVSFPHSARSRRSLLPNNTGIERDRIESWIHRLDVRPPRAEAIVATLSGGNQQKILLAKWLSTNPVLLLLHEPTQAVDIGARRSIVNAVNQAAKAGAYVIVAGSDENELAMLCDRVLVFEEGRVAREISAPLTPDDIVSAIYTGGVRARLRGRTPGEGRQLDE